MMHLCDLTFVMVFVFIKKIKKSKQKSLVGESHENISIYLTDNDILKADLKHPKLLLKSF